MKQTFRVGPFVRAGLWLALVLAASGAWIGHAQQPAQQPGTPAADDPHFTGLSTTMESKDLSTGRRRFEAGARSAWHTHERGQLIFVEQGRARTQKRGQPIREMDVGESDYTGPNIEHWHGAAPDQPFVQVSVGWGGATNWLQRTTDEEYSGKKK
jgi:quercetin dioxygenase-like cupin family protein